MAFMENDKIIEKVAEYLSIAPHLTEFDNDERYRRANQLALELAVWLPLNLYVMLGRSISNPSQTCNPATVINALRAKYGDKENVETIVICHAPGIGKKGKS